MYHETESRRSGFLGGIPVQLANGEFWAFPGPRELSSEGATRDSKLSGLLEAISQSEDFAEQSRMELALAIYLITLNYDLTPKGYLEVLGDGADVRVREQLRACFHDIARRHAEAVVSRSPAAKAEPPKMGRRFRFPLFHPAHQPAAASSPRQGRVAS